MRQQADDAQAELTALGERVRNWGRWGDDDERGTLNHITDEHRVRAAALVRRGAVFSLALPIENGKGPMVTGIAGRTNPVHQMVWTGDAPGPIELGGTADMTDDMLVMGCQTSTQWDALCHVYYGGRLYNGFPADGVTTDGAERDGIGKAHDGFVGRGVLLDVPRAKDVDRLEPAYAITTDDLVACAERQGVEVGDGDIVVVRTGAMSEVVDDDWTGFHARPRPGLHHTTAAWMAERRIAAVAADNNAVEAPSTLPGIRNPLHMLALRDMGLHLGEYWYLEELADDCAGDGVYEFMLVAQPLRLERGAGSPINPIALK